jgi:xanthine dehydrogenase YagT iron-sulfur-binding subunit
MDGRAGPPERKGQGLTRREFVASTLAAGATIVPALAGSGAARGDQRPAQLQRGAPVEVTLRVNGKPWTLHAMDPRTTLLDGLRENLSLFGTKKGCDHGQCGACTVLVDGKRVLSCLTLAVSAAGREVTTVEGLAQGDELHPVQAAFIKHDAFQCGYCTPGQICSAAGLVSEGRARSTEEIREEMSGNLCRCGAYVNIVAAVKEVVDASPARGRGTRG